VVWDYQLVDSGSPSDVEVVLVAIKSDLLDEVNGAVEGAGLRTTVVDVSPMALYNAYRYNYSDLSGSSLIIDIGARTTNLIFIEPKKVFSRSIPIGGTKITEAIAKDFNEPFGAAEERKRRDGFVSLGGAYAEPDDPEIARVSKMIRNTMTRLHAEISRSISFYKSQQHGAQPTRVFLCGGSAGLPYMREFFQRNCSFLSSISIRCETLPSRRISTRKRSVARRIRLASWSGLRCAESAIARWSSTSVRQLSCVAIGLQNSDRSSFWPVFRCCWLCSAGGCSTIARQGHRTGHGRNGAAAERVESLGNADQRDQGRHKTAG
jgi:hypothetical protein